MMKNKAKRLCTCCLLSILVFPVHDYCQVDTTHYTVDDIMSEIISESEDDNNLEGIIDLIEDLAQNKIDLNKASISDFQRIPGIDLETAKSIIEYRNKYGNFFSIRELNSIKSIQGQMVKRIIPFVKVELYKTEHLQNNNVKFFNSLEIRSRVLKDLQPENGFTENKFYGSRYKAYTRIKMNIKNKFNIGATFDKDPGERSFNDFTSAYFSINNFGIIDKAIIGDYLVEFGQGLALWSPYSFSKSSNAISPLNKNPRYIREYRSSDENKFFRGTAFDLALNKFRLLAFYSDNFFDAGIDSSTGEIISNPVDGLHRTETEILKKHTSSEKLAGSILTYNIPDKLSIGFLYYHSKLSNNFYSKSIYDIQGDNFNYYSLSYNYYFKNIYLSGENSFDGKSLASILNLSFELVSGITIISSFRNYPGNYTNLHGSGFGEKNGSTKNEVGFYNGIRYRTDFGVFNFYFDQFKFPYSSFNSLFPASGNELMLNYEVRAAKNFIFSFRYKNENKEITKTGEIRKEITKSNKSSLRFGIKYQPDYNLRITNRVELSRYSIGGTEEIEKGFLIFQDIKFQPADNLYLYGRIIFFKTGSFNTAIYEFENDLDGIFSVSGLSGEGTRWYFLLKYKPFEVMNLSLKYSELYKPKEKKLGSGYSEIEGNFDNRLSFQIDFSF